MKFLFIALLFIPLLVPAQAPEEILSRYEKYPVEKVFLQLDKGEYLAGEPLQFKGYVICRGRLTKISTNLYVELLNKEKKTVVSCQAPVMGGVSEGFIILPENLPENVYYIRAYTNWMLNFDEAFQFVEPVNVYNNSSSKKLIKAAQNWAASLHPEGGKWLTGLVTKVGVRVQSNGDLPSNLRGFLFEGNDTTKKLADVHFYNSEIGSFSLAPVAGKQYSVWLSDGNKNSTQLSLPAAVDEGISIQALATPGAVAYRLQSKGITGQLKGCRIVAYSKGLMIFSGVIPTTRDAAEGKIMLEDKDGGVVAIAVFDAAGKLVAERLCYAEGNVPASMQPLITSSIRSDAAKGLNQLQLTSADTLYRHTWLLRVTDGLSPISWPNQNLTSAFVLNDLVKLPRQAAYYTNPNYKDRMEALDYLLISEPQGIYNWAYLLQHPAPAVTHFPDNNLSYRGRIITDDKPVVNEDATILLTLKDSTNILRQVKTNDKGVFVINKIFFTDSAKAYFHIHKKTRYDAFCQISFNQVWDTAAYSLPLPVTAYELANTRDANINERVQRYAQALSSFDLSGTQEGKLLETVTIKAVKNLTEELNKELSTPIFSDVAEVVEDFVNKEQDIGGIPLLEYLSDRLPGFTALPGKAPKFRGSDIPLYLDEMPADIDMINLIPVANIAMVKLLRNAFALGHPNGALAVYTKRGKLYTDAQPGNKPAKFTWLTGYPRADHFKQVDYAIPATDKGIRDTRTVLLWKPVFKRNDLQLNFYNNDVSKKLQLLLTGLDSAGNPFYIQKDF